MDSLAFAKAHEDQWERLRYLTDKRSLTGAEADEFVQLYQAAASHLATIRTQAPDPDVVLTLSATVSKARGQLTEPRGATLRSLWREITETMPYAFYRIRWWIHGVTLAFLAVAAIVFFYFATNPDQINLLGTDTALRRYADEAFAAYYREYPGFDFGGMVWTNNAWIALQAIGGGVTGIYPVWILFQNAVSIGQSAAVMNYADNLDVFFKLILPHGLMELTAVFVAGAAGIRLFWALLMPGDLPRSRSLAREAKWTMHVAFGLIAVLFISALVEAGITPSYLPWQVKIMIGAAVLGTFWTWVYIFGREASRNQETVAERELVQYAA
ncbi:stage II sporulation protein M [Trueperella bialowiezensis]|uniref:Integral membrane protein DUF95 n=1 Tax=Trueperella bialowiezensis TaxID=312285 RepID=A0A448PDA4_9ACTO|nr:stage II sporulation protein M [Trueperella bialowiezensis]VEI12897.1 Integral membrane protein DUF95 [Trueperella bialowiezensis]